MRANRAPASGPDLDRLAQKAFAAHQDGALAQADRLYRAMLDRDPDNVDVLHQLGWLSYQRGRLAEALRFLTAAVRRDAGFAAALSDLGLAQHALERYAEALASHDAALALAPDNPDYINRRAVTLSRLGRHGEALVQLDRALALAPGNVDVLGNRGNVLVRLNRPLDAIAAYDGARSLVGDTAQLLTNRAHALRRLDRVEEAVTDLETAIALRPDFAEAHFELGVAQLALADFARGWTSYERRWDTGAFAPSRRGFTSPRWTGAQPLAGRTILLHAEQGLGDTIQFVRYVPLVAQRGARVVLEVQPELMGLLRGIDGAARVVAHGDKLPRFDLHCPLMSLPGALGTRADSIPAAIPYITVAQAWAEHWAGRLSAARPRIGLVWAGRTSHHNDLNRSIPLAQLAPLLGQGGVEIVSLQRELRDGDDALLRAHPNVRRLGEELADLADTAALISRLDAVVSVDTAVAHLAGALGRPLLLLLPFAADFRWLRGREDSPWYPSARLLRQPAFGAWRAVVDRVTELLVAGRC
jgi:tetratricopeptide (TPR) repeat protein